MTRGLEVATGVEMDFTVVVLPSVPELGVAVGRAKVEVATGGDMSRVGTGSVGTEGTARSEVRTADMDPSEEMESEAGRTSLVKPMSMKALVAFQSTPSLIRTRKDHQWASNAFDQPTHSCKLSNPWNTAYHEVHDVQLVDYRWVRG